MAISQGMCVSAKAEFLQGIHAFGTDVFKIALYPSTATLSPSTTAYSATGEVSGTGYTAGGNTISGVTVSTYGTTGIVTFTNPTWPASTITARGALIYNSSKANRAVAVINFGIDKVSAGSPFTITLPTATDTSALIRLG